MCIIFARNNITAIQFKGTSRQEVLYEQALTRAYYSIFHAMRAVLALDLFDSKKHSGIIAEFNKRHVKTGEFDRKFGRMIKDAEIIRSESDYKDFFTADKEQGGYLAGQMCHYFANKLI